MKYPVKYAAPAMLALGGLGLVIRRLLYSLALEEGDLLLQGHPLETVLWLLTLAAGAAVLLAALRTGKGLPRCRWSAPALMAGQCLMALALAATVLTNEPKLPGLAGTSWTGLGLLAALGLLLTSCGKGPRFLLQLPVCLFLMVHMVCQYRSWSAEPQLQAYVFALLGCVAMTLFSYYRTAFDAALGNSRLFQAAGLAGIYLCTVNLARTEYPLLYLGGIVWMFCLLCGGAFLPPEPERTAQDVSA